MDYQTCVISPPHPTTLIHFAFYFILPEIWLTLKSITELEREQFYCNFQSLKFICIFLTPPLYITDTHVQTYQIL